MSNKKKVLIISLSVAILSALWQLITVIYDNSNLMSLGLIGVAGFLGWSTYFAAGGKKQGLIIGLASNLSGVFWAAISVLIGMLFKNIYISAFIPILIAAFMMVFQSNIKLFRFIPGTFIGSCTFFALGGTLTWNTILGSILGLVIGLFLGLISDLISNYFIKSGEK